MEVGDVAEGGSLSMLMWTTFLVKRCRIAMLLSLSTRPSIACKPSFAQSGGSGKVSPRLPLASDKERKCCARR